jgi:hypothetical protein
MESFKDAVLIGFSFDQEAKDLKGSSGLATRHCNKKNI